MHISKPACLFFSNQSASPFGEIGIHCTVMGLGIGTQVKWVHVAGLHVSGGWVADCLPPDLMLAGRYLRELQDHGWAKVLHGLPVTQTFVMKNQNIGS
jgi:hypothetical protein